MKSLSPSTLESILMTPIIRTSRPGAFSSTAIICVIVAAFALQPYSSIAEARQVALPGPQCHPSVVRSMPERIRKICDALKVIWDFNDSMENYLDEKAKSPQSKRTLLNVQPPRPTTLRQSQTLKVICLIPTLNRSLPICTSPSDVEEESFSPMAERRPIYNSGVKRQDGEDVDHVFLRFGKRG